MEISREVLALTPAYRKVDSLAEQCSCCGTNTGVHRCNAGRRPIHADTAASPGSQASPGPDDFMEGEYEIDIMGLDGDAGPQQAPVTSNCEEAAILLIMEFTGVGRPAAMDLLAEFGGDAAPALANLYQ